MKKYYLKLYKSGKFYNAYGDDALILHELFNYKFNEIKKNAGFPENALGKVRTKLEDKKVSYQVYEFNELKISFDGIDNEYKKLVSSSLKRVEYEKRLTRVRETLEKMELSDLEKLLSSIEEKHLNEQEQF